MAPRNKLLATIVPVDDTLNQGRALCVHGSLTDRSGEFFSIGGSTALAVSFASVESFNQRRVVPIFDIVVLTIMESWPDVHGRGRSDQRRRRS
jgi:hypothetical protein